ncbi:hypothetical protein NE237_000330 [Protea cynaroides]|uniref:Uncharacterized protein n=1 Tax=Protea cynaroides TaxID=273540 RepID=A0A9Q0QXD8_9MAGN|nr:hypothetical protein NE237_000330 [Protea cynaroides]
MANMSVEDKGCICPNEMRTFVLDASNLIITWRLSGIDICEGGVGNHKESKGKILVQKGAVGKHELRLTVQTRFTIEGAGRSGEGWISWEPATDVDQKLYEIQKLSYTTREYSATRGHSTRCLFGWGSSVGSLVSVIVKITIRFSFYEGQTITTTLNDQAQTGNISTGNYKPR